MNRSIRHAVLAGAVALAACSQPDAPAAHGVAGDAAVPMPSADPLTVTVIGHDYSFDAPDTVPSGPSMIRLVNQGAELHHIQVFRLEGGHTFEDLDAAFARGEEAPWAVPVGGPVAAAPGAEIATELNLEPGTYALTCLIHGADGVPHMAKGMARGLAVMAHPAPPAPTPATMDLELRDYGFVFAAEVTPGTHTFRVFNTAAQPHEVVFVRLADGVTARHLIAWAKTMEGAPPAPPIGGVAGIAMGEENRVTLTFERGRYAVVCFAPDATDGRAHHEHGMVREFEVL